MSSRTSVVVGVAPVVVVASSGGPNMLIRLLWFLLIGWWLGGLISGLAWLLLITVIGLPLGVWLINRLPSVITLRPQETGWRYENGVLRQGREQYPFLIRAVWFLCIGWWLSGVFMAVAYLSLITVVLIPLSFWLYGRVGAAATLYRS